MELEEDLAIEPDPLVDWRMLYLDYLLHDTLPTNRIEAQWLACPAKSFILMEGELYKRVRRGCSAAGSQSPCRALTLVRNTFRQGF